MIKLASLAVILPFGVSACSSDWGECFVEGTLVDTPRGLVPIEILQVGDLVWSMVVRGRQGERVARPVLATLKACSPKVRAISAGTCKIAGVTSGHPFYDLARGEYRSVRDLKPSDVLVSYGENGELQPRVIDAIAATNPPDNPIDVFNLTIGGPEANYFASGLLVHNKTPAIPICTDAEITISPHPPGNTPGDFDVHFSETPLPEPVSPPMFSAIGKSQPELAVVPISETTYRVSLTAADPGDYTLRVSAMFPRGDSVCEVRKEQQFYHPGKEDRARSWR